MENNIDKVNGLITDGFNDITNKIIDIQKSFEADKQKIASAVGYLQKEIDDLTADTNNKIKSVVSAFDIYNSNITNLITAVNKIGNSNAQINKNLNTIFISLSNQMAELSLEINSIKIGRSNHKPKTETHFWKNCYNSIKSSSIYKFIYNIITYRERKRLEKLKAEQLAEEQRITGENKRKEEEARQAELLRLEQIKKEKEEKKRQQIKEILAGIKRD